MLKALALLLLPAAALAEMPEKFTNLKVLPEGVSKPELMATMRGFSFEVGVRCEHCHERAKAGLDFASDAKEEKRTARAMIRMTRTINAELATMGARMKVECVTCHRGLPVPRSLNEVLTEKLEQKGAPEATALYRELRKKYYGSAAYDFSEVSLNRLGESLLAKNKPGDAAAMMELNAEVNDPLSSWALGVLAMAHEASGARDKAIADYQRILVLDPHNEWAQKQLADLQRR